MLRENTFNAHPAGMKKNNASSEHSRGKSSLAVISAFLLLPTPWCKALDTPVIAQAELDAQRALKQDVP